MKSSAVRAAEAPSRFDRDDLNVDGVHPSLLPTVLKYCRRQSIKEGVQRTPALKPPDCVS